MTALFAQRALLPEGWASNVRITVAADGRIENVLKDAARDPRDHNLVNRILLPAPANLHSHAFQRAMAGMTEYRSAADDDFWSWRELMYRFLDVLTPGQIEAIAALVYVEMLEAGYAAVGEFHYVHHRPGGGSYDNIAETSERIFAAVAETGIGLTHLPVLYTFGGAGKQPLAGGQLRFGCDDARFQELHAAARSGLGHLPADCAIGIAPHSLRATGPQQMKALADAYPGGPIHIHAAEQDREVAEIEAWLGARPVEWLLGEAGADARWCLIHATQMNDTEIAGLARSGAVAGLCPITEANLGDGTFNARDFVAENGGFGVGSDSNVRISLSGELSQLEYSQRLRHKARNVLSGKGVSTGRNLFLRAAEGGARAIGRDSGALEAGRLADIVALDAGHLSLCGLRDDQILDGWIFAADDRVVSDVWSAGRHCVINGRHVRRDAVERRYRSAMAELLGLL
ncbi:formimidoylglutamate deiminase [Nitratireductor sp. XY-223]|uniref:formimidoylglutamate deiminase n=1 Tax=Nitratireductor sp. XY-223 TaxID=2561926 RepID=UPI0010AAC80A|nr:formimidoylglutamate deiminase [Nitratireductor sp. XY-223]